MACFVGKGTLLKITLSESLTTVANVVSIAGPSGEMEMVEYYDLSGGAMSVLPSGIYSNGEVSFVLNYDPTNATHQGLFTQFEAGTVVACRIDWPGSGPYWTFNAAISNLGLGSTEKSSVTTLEGTVKISGAITRVAS